ncbi:MAG: WbqC family protein [Candidatus Omnitrophica bacterium]|nr:WbqC family protein [Candidatus Omnitrophota bacterium]
MPWLGYFDKIAKSDAFVFMDQGHYKESEFQNRNKIRTDRGALWLTVPVISKCPGRQKISDVFIDHDIDWRKQHLESLRTYYGRAAYFKKYIGFFEDLYDRRWERLGKLNVLITRFILKELGIDTPLYFESELCTTATKAECITELCLKMKADKYLFGSGGRDYSEEEKFKQAGITLVYQKFEHPVYRQQYMRDKDHFLAHLSTVDLLFNVGPDSRKVLELT